MGGGGGMLRKRFEVHTSAQRVPMTLSGERRGYATGKAHYRLVALARAGRAAARSGGARRRVVVSTFE